MNKKKVIIITVIAIALIGIGIKVIGIGGLQPAMGGMPDEESSAMPVQVQTVTHMPITATVTTKGNVEIDNKEIIGAESVAKILEVAVKKGDEVIAGDVIIHYDPKSREDLENRLQEARLSLKSAQVALSGTAVPASQSELLSAQSGIDQSEQSVLSAQNALEQLEIAFKQELDDLAEAQETYDKNKILFDQGVISQSELDVFKKEVDDKNTSIILSKSKYQSAKDELAAAQKALSTSQRSYEAIKNKTSEPGVRSSVAQNQVTVEQRQLEIRQLEKQLAEFKLTETSPIDGTVIDIYVENGSVTQEGEKLVMIGNTDDIFIQTYLTEYDAPVVEVGQEVELTGDAIRNKTLKGLVRKIDPAAQERQGSSGNESVVGAEISIIGVDHKLKPGYSINAKIITADMDAAIVVPIMSLVNEKDNKYYIFVLNEDNTVTKRPVEVITVATIDAAIDGVTEGEVIVSSPSMMLEDGMEIQPIYPEEELAGGDEQ